MSRPRIIIPEIHQNISNYTNAVYAAGMEPVVVSIQSIQLAHKSQQEFMDSKDVSIASVDGLLIPGGGDINPCAYGEENHGSNPVDQWVDTLQFEILDDFLKYEKPVLGICRGLQLINVRFGGTLIQDLEDAGVHRFCSREGDQVHTCRCEKDSWLIDLYGETFVHNSNHHQAVLRLGKGLKADSRCPLDGVIESLHHEELPVYAVQWHPERMCLSHARSDTVDGLDIFRFFCRLCGGTPDLDDPYADRSFRQSEIMYDGLGL